MYWRFCSLVFRVSPCAVLMPRGWIHIVCNHFHHIYKEDWTYKTEFFYIPTYSSTAARSPVFTGYGALHSRYNGVRYSQDAVSQGCNMWTFLFDLMPRQRRCPPVVAVYHDRSNLLHTDASRYQTKSARNKFAVHPRSHTQTHPRPTIHTYTVLFSQWPSGIGSISR